MLVGADMAKDRDTALLSQLVAKLELQERVIFAGPQPSQRIPDYFTAADASVLASYREGCPNVVLESLACGRPVVATRVCGVPYMVADGVNGLLVRWGNVTGLAGALLRVLGDLQLRTDMGRRGREMAAARFRADGVAAQTLSLYRQLVAG